MFGMRRREFISLLGGAVAARRARAATDAPSRGSDAYSRHRPGGAGPGAGFGASAPTIRLDRRPQFADRIAVGGRQRRAKPRGRRGVCCTRARCDHLLGFGHNGGDEARDLIDPGGIRGGERTGRAGVRRQPGAARRQHHRFHLDRLYCDWEIGGICSRPWRRR